jgi:Flp pilus assembly protein TadG
LLERHGAFVPLVEFPYAISGSRSSPRTANRSATREVPVILRRRSRDRRHGAAVLEFAVLLPVLVFLAVIGTDWARLFYYTISIESCARTGALWAADPSTQSESKYTNVTDAARSGAPNLNPAPTVTQTAVTIDGRPGVRVTVTGQFNTITTLPGVPSSQTLTRFVEMRIVPVAPN